MAKKPVVCPYCWHRSNERDLEYRCGESCTKREYFISPKSLPATCVHGERPLTRRHCPECKRPLLREYIDVDGQSVAVIGTAGSGKTTYIGVLLHELRHRVASQFGNMALDLLGDESRDNFTKRFERPMYGENRVPLKTVELRARPRMAEDDDPVRPQERNLEPLIFTLKSRSAGGFLKRADNSKTVLSVFYDTAGENLERANALDLLGRYLSTAGGIILLIDPVQMTRVRQRCFAGLPTPSRVADQQASVARLGELLTELGSRGSGRVRTPLAVVLTKFDALRDTFEPDSPLRRAPQHDGVYDDVDGRDVHEEVKSWLNEWFGPHLDASLEANFAEYRYFAMSALGAAPSGDRLSPSGIQPYRVEDPMLWFLARAGLVKNRSGAR